MTDMLTHLVQYFVFLFRVFQSQHTQIVYYALHNFEK